MPGHPARSTTGPRAILLCPGPVLLSKAVRRAVAETDMGHREPDFSAILVACGALIRPLAGLDDSYEVAFITGSGTAANETVLSSLGRRGPVLVLTNGEFGERLHAAASLHNADVDCVAAPWQQPIDLDAVEAALARRRYAMVAVVHHETSTGMLNPVRAIAALARAHGAIVAVDAISSIGAEEIRAAEWGVDVLVGASGKALSAMPGVGIIAVRSALLDTLAAEPSTGRYLDLYNHFHYMRSLEQTPNTPAVHVVVSLHAALQEIAQVGVARFQATIRARAAETRREVARMGLRYADYGSATSSVITCVELPEQLGFDALARRFKRKGIVIYNGKGALKDRVFQIGHIGALRRRDTAYALRQLEKALARARAAGAALPAPADPTQAVVRGVA